MSKGLIVSIFLIILFSTLACRLSGELVDEPDQIIILTEEAVAVNEKLEQAAKDAEQKGTFTLEITEQQLASYVAINLASQSSIPITELQIRLRDEQIRISGIAHQDNLQLPLSVGVRVGVDEANNFRLEFTEAKLGPFPLPQIILESITKEVQKALAEQMAKVGEGYSIQEISIGEGSILIRGIKK